MRRRRGARCLVAFLIAIGAHFFVAGSTRAETGTSAAPEGFTQDYLEVLPLTTNAGGCGDGKIFKLKDGHSGKFHTFKIKRPATSPPIEGIEVRLVGRSTDESANASFDVALEYHLPPSAKAMTQVRAVPDTGSLSSEFTSYSTGGPEDSWGRAWSWEEVERSDFAVEVVARTAGPETEIDCVVVTIFVESGSVTPTPGATPTPAPTPTPSPGPGLAILDPADGAEVSESFALVTGTFSLAAGASDPGVRVKGVVAEVNGTNFAALVPLDEGANSILAELVDSSGVVASTSILIQSTAPNDDGDLFLHANPRSGLAPLDVTFSLMNLGAIVGAQIVAYEADYDGDGQPDFSSPDLETFDHTYSTEGLFFPTIAAVNDSGGKNIARGVVNVLPAPDLLAIWTAFRDALRAQDIEGALTFVSTGSRERYREAFTALGSQLSNIDAALTSDITVLRIDGNVAQVEMRRSSPTGDRRFFIVFARGEDGRWKIRSF